MHKHKNVIKSTCILIILLCYAWLSGCSNNNQTIEVDFIAKYQIALENVTDISAQLQQAIDELPKNGILFLQNGIYPISKALEFKSDMTFKLSEDAILLNQIQGESALMAFNHPLKYDKAEGCNNITIQGGTWDMNGSVGADGLPVHLPNANTTGALGLAYGKNFVLKDITFKDSYNGHMIQLCAVEQVLIENCRFEGQSFQGNGNKTRELIQIEPGSIKGYPYTLVQDVRPTTNVTIKGCFFGGSERSPQYMVGLGNHGQQNGVKCSDITVQDCTFENAEWAAIRFWAFDRMTIRNNQFHMTDISQQQRRYAILADSHPYGAVIADGGAENTYQLVIENNKIIVDSDNVNAISVLGNGGSPQKPKNITIRGNTITGKQPGTAIELFRVENCKIVENIIVGYKQAVTATDSVGEVDSDMEIIQHSLTDNSG